MTAQCRFGQRAARYCVTLFAGTLLLAAVVADAAANPYLISDVNDGPIMGPSVGCTPVSVGAGAYFCDGKNYHLWHTDGTQQGTYEIRDAQGQRFRFPSLIAASRDKLYFKVSDRLWVTDGTPDGTQPLREAGGGQLQGDMDLAVPYDGGLYFFQRGSLWKTDGVDTVLVKAVPLRGAPEGAIMSGGRLFFIDYYHQLWQSDGTGAGTSLVSDLPGLSTGATSQMADLNGVLVFSLEAAGETIDLWKSDGTASGTVLIKQGVGARYHTLLGFQAVGSLVYFVDDFYANLETPIWVTDGTEAGTRQVATIPEDSYFEFAREFNGSYVVTTRGGNPGAYSVWTLRNPGASPVALSRSVGNYSVVASSGKLYFAADDGSGTGSELWRSNGSVAGTRLVRDIAWGPKSSNPSYLAALDTGIIFQANRGNRLGGDAIWFSDGTPGGTRLVADLYNVTKDAYPSELTAVGGDVYFLANMTNAPNVFQQWELWKSDGTDAGTYAVANLIKQRTGGKGIRYGNEYKELLAFDGVLFFTGRDDQGRGLWKTDGTPMGTEPLQPLLRAAAGEIHNLTVYKNRLYFFADFGDGDALWRLSRNHRSAERVSAGLSTPNDLTVVGNRLYFINASVELWRSFGTSTSTAKVTDIDAGPDTAVTGLFAIDGRRFGFAVEWQWIDWERRYKHTELWASDGTPRRTGRLADQYPADLLVAGNALWYNDYTTGLWRFDAASDRPVLLTDESSTHLTFVEGSMYFYKSEFAQIWRSDGTPAGTEPVVFDIGWINRIGALGNSIYFSGYDTEPGKPWSWQDSSLALRKFDPTTGDTTTLAEGVDVYSVIGDASSGIFIGNRRWDDSAYGPLVSPLQFWQTDGTTAGTRELTDFPALKAPLAQLQIGRRVYMSLNTGGGAGIELWGLDLP